MSERAGTTREQRARLEALLYGIREAPECGAWPVVAPRDLRALLFDAEALEQAREDVRACAEALAFLNAERGCGCCGGDRLHEAIESAQSALSRPGVQAARAQEGGE